MKRPGKNVRPPGQAEAAAGDARGSGGRRGQL